MDNNTQKIKIDPHLILKNSGFKLYLQQELIRRIKQNPNYSLRSFAKNLEIEPSSLSQILSNKRTLTDKMILKLSNKLSLSPKEINKLINGNDQKSQDKNYSQNDLPFAHFKHLEQDQFDLVANWYHFAILEMTHLHNFVPKMTVIAKRLDLTLFEVRDAVARLTRLNFLEITKNGKWIDKMGDALNEGNSYTTAAFRKMQLDVLKKASDALENTPYQERVQSSLTISTSRKKVLGAKKKILKFMEELDAYLRSGDEQEDVFHLSVSLYPVTKKMTE